MEAIIETKNLTKRFSSKIAVNKVNMHICKKDIYGLIGKNGAGKTTIMKLLLGLNRPTEGEISLFGGAELTKERKKIGSLIENPGLYKNCTAYENMVRFSILYGASKEEIQPILDMVGLGDTGSKKAGEFSLGMRQRLGIAIALLSHPEVLILDEPINGLDPAGIREIRDIILRLNQEGVTFLISSHLLDELAKVVTKYGIIADGRLLEEITAAELQQRCCKYVRIVCSDAQKALMILQNNFVNVKASIQQECIHLASHFDRTAQINTLLVQSGISVSELIMNEGGFEEYFIERLGK